MTRLSTTRHPRGRRVIGRTLLAATLLTAVATVPAAAAVAPQRTTTAAARDDVSEAEAQQVSHFYASYLDAVAAEDGGNLATALRGFYLTPELRQELRAWEKTNHADGVLRAQDVPAAFRVTAGDSGAGHAWTHVRLTWGSVAHPTYTNLTVQSELGTGKISGIRG
ncbi:hypothetical protein AMK09_37325 [Streptomyces sp. CB02488]|uniref:hypothetical protein n=1 Tax=Streptomyces sp. CB02488 TaxID=1703920 RepID=UPI00093E3CBC|nr:hypothetical protein [Streptomyces sp. CB02488]OKK05345.1 hypothetical protein AMK09_37325 [Streptomyces sp. CB02488]